MLAYADVDSPREMSNANRVVQQGRNSTGLPPGGRVGIPGPVPSTAISTSIQSYTCQIPTVSNASPIEVNTANMVWTIPEWNVHHRSYRSIKSRVFQQLPNSTEWQFEISATHGPWSSGRAELKLRVVKFPTGMDTLETMIGVSLCHGDGCTLCQTQTVQFPIAETTEAFTFKETTREYVKPGIILYGTLSDLPELRLHCRLLLKKSPVERNSDLSRTVGQLLTDSTFSDVTIFTGDASFPAHKNILAGRSQVFRAMFVSMMAETRGNRVDLSIFSPTAVKLMLEYIYTDKTNMLDGDVGELLRIADMYELEGLKADAALAIAENLNTENAAEAFQLSRLYRLEVLRTTVVEYIKQNGIGRAVAEHPTFMEFVRTDPAGAVQLFSAILD